MKLKVKKIAAIMVLAFAPLLAAKVSVADGGAAKIAVVNESKLMKEVKAIKTFQEKIAKLESEFKTSVLSHAQELEKAASNLLEAKDKYSKDELQKKAVALTNRQQEVSARDKQTAQKIEAALLPAMDQIKKAMAQAVETVAKKKGFDIVLHELSVAYTTNAFDITDDVQKELEANLKEVKIDLPKI